MLIQLKTYPLAFVRRAATLLYNAVEGVIAIPSGAQAFPGAPRRGD